MIRGVSNWHTLASPDRGYDVGFRQVDLVGHSAGGWLGRAFTADTKYFEGDTGKYCTSNSSTRDQSTDKG